MKNRSIVTVALATLALLSAFCLPGDEREQLNQASNTFSWSLFDNIGDLKKYGDLSASHITKEELNKLPLFLRANKFLTANATAYVSVREKSLSRYPPPPDSIAGYEPVKSKMLEEYLTAIIEKDGQLIPFYSLKAFDVQQLINDVFGGLTMWIAADEKENQSIQERTLLSYQHFVFGKRIYARPLGNNVWHVALYSHPIAYRFKWDVRHNKLTDISFYRNRYASFHVEKYKETVPEYPALKATDEEIKLADETNEYAWKLYNKYRFEIKSILEPTATAPLLQELTSFFNSHIDTYMDIRKQYLQACSPAPDSLNGYTQLHNDQLELALKTFLDDSGKLLPFYAIRMTRPEELASGIAALTAPQMKEAEEEMAPADIGLVIAGSYFFGYQLYATPKTKDTWELCYRTRLYAYRFTWDIRTDHITDITYWRNKTNISKLTSPPAKQTNKPAAKK